MTLTRKIWLALALIGMLLLGGALWLLYTESGARWALSRAATFLPRQLVIGETAGTLLGGLRIRSVEWLDDTVSVRSEDVYLNIELIPLVFSYLDVNELTASRLSIAIQASDEPDDTPGMPTVDLPIDISLRDGQLKNVSYQSDAFTYAADSVDLAASLFGSDLSVSRLRLRNPQLDLDLDGRLALKDWYASRTRVVWRWRESDELVFAGELALQGDMRRFDLRNSLTAPVTLSTSGSIALDSGTLLASLTNEWQSLELSLGDRLLQSSAGTLRLDGSVNEYSVSLDASAQLDDLPETRIELTGDASTEAIRVSHLRLTNEWGDLAANGNARWRPDQTYDLDFSLSGLDATRLSDLVTGRLEMDGNVSGRFGEQGFELRISRLGGDVNGFPLDGSGIVNYAQESLEISDARLRIGSNSAMFSGSLGAAISLDADLELTTLTEVLPDASGSLRGRVTLRGTRDRPDIVVDLAGTAMRWKEYAAADLSIDASVFQDKPGSAAARLRQVSMGDTTLDSAEITASGRLNGHSLRISLTGYESELDVSAEGGLQDDAWSGRMTSLEIVNEALGRWATRQQSSLDVSLETVAVSETCLFPPADPGRACFGGSYRREGLAAIEFSLSDLPLSAFRMELPAEASLTGFVDARLNVVSRDGRLTGTAGAALREAQFVATYEGETISVSFPEAAGSATINDNRVDSAIRVAMAEGAGTADLELAIQDLADRQSAIAGQGNVSINDTSLSAVFLPGITNPRGRIEGGLTISGTFGEPAFIGEIALTAGAFVVRRAGIEVVDIDVRLGQSAPGQLQLRGTARSGDGQIRLQGDTRLGTDSGFRTELILTGDNFELARLPEWQVAASPSIRAVFDERSATVVGALGIPAANIIVNEIPETAESPSPDAIVHRGEGTEAYTGRRLALDVTTILGSEVRFSGFGLTARVDGAVRLQGGTREAWTGNGVLNLRDGRYRAYGQELEIERGELLFNGPLDNPQLDIRAVRRVDDVNAGIQLSGTPSQLRSVIFSEPVMSDAEALSYLLTGRPLSGSVGEVDVLNSAAFALGVSGAGRVASQVRSGLGLETLTVEGGSENGRIVAGKRFGDRLLVEYGYGLIDKLGTLLLRYQLSERIMLESRTGTVSNLDLVYSVKKQ